VRTTLDFKHALTLFGFLGSLSGAVANLLSLSPVLSLPRDCDSCTQHNHSSRKCKPTHHSDLLVLLEIDRSTNQSISRLINQAIDQSIDQSINQSVNQSINQSTKQSINQSINQSIFNNKIHIISPLHKAFSIRLQSTALIQTVFLACLNF